MNNEMKIEELLALLEKNAETLKNEDTDIDTGIRLYEESLKLFEQAEKRLSYVKQKVLVYNTETQEAEEFDEI